MKNSKNKNIEFEVGLGQFIKNQNSTSFVSGVSKEIFDFYFDYFMKNYPNNISIFKILETNYQNKVKTREFDYTNSDDPFKFQIDPLKTIILQKIIDRTLDVTMDNAPFSLKFRFSEELNYFDQFVASKPENYRFKSVYSFRFDCFLIDFKIVHIQHDPTVEQYEMIYDIEIEYINILDLNTINIPSITENFLSLIAFFYSNNFRK